MNIQEKESNIPFESKSVDPALKKESDAMKKESLKKPEDKIRGYFGNHTLMDDMKPDMQNLERNKMHDSNENKDSL